MSKAIAALILALGLGACTVPQQVGQFTLADLQAADAIAKAGGDPVGAKCWDQLIPIAQTLSDLKAAGVATSVETYRVLTQNGGGECAPILVPVLLKLGLIGGAVKLAPLAAGIPVPIP